jgi:hypothetical protein
MTTRQFCHPIVELVFVESCDGLTHGVVVTPEFTLLQDSESPQYQTITSQAVLPFPWTITGSVIKITRIVKL